MTLLSIFFRNRFKESSQPPKNTVVNDPVDGGFKTTFWFWGAADRIAKAIDKKQPSYTMADKLLGKHLKVSKKQKQADSASSNPTFAVAKKKETDIKLTARVFREAKALKSGLPTEFDVVIIEEGLGNFGDAFYYTKEALESAVKLFEGEKCFVDHPARDEEENRPERSTRDIIGHFEGVKTEMNDGGCTVLTSTLDVLNVPKTELQRAQMARAVENKQKFPEKEFIGLSINAGGDSEEKSIDDVMAMAPEGAKPKLQEAKEQGIDTVRVVSLITSVVSCDLVTAAGAGGKILNIIEGEKTDGKKERK